MCRYVWGLMQIFWGGKDFIFMFLLFHPPIFIFSMISAYRTFWFLIEYILLHLKEIFLLPRTSMWAQSTIDSPLCLTTGQLCYSWNSAWFFSKHTFSHCTENVLFQLCWSKGLAHSSQGFFSDVCVQTSDSNFFGKEARNTSVKVKI